MKRFGIAICLGFLLVAPAKSFAASVVLDYYSAAGFTSGALAGQPIHFAIVLDGDTGGGDGIGNQSHFQGVSTTASLNVGTTIIFSTVLFSDVFMADDEGLNYIESTIAGVHSVFSSPGLQGPVLGH